MEEQQLYKCLTVVYYFLYQVIMIGMRALYKVSKGSVVTIKSSTNTFNGSRGYETFAVALYK